MVATTLGHPVTSFRETMHAQKHHQYHKQHQDQLICDLILAQLYMMELKNITVSVYSDHYELFSFMGK